MSIHTLGKPESELTKVATLDLFHSTALPLLLNGRVFDIATQPRWGEGKGERAKMKV